MRRNHGVPIAGLCLALALSLSGGAAAQAPEAEVDVCAEAAGRLCADETGRTAVVACLMRHQGDLSAACLNQTRKQWSASVEAECTEDAARHCADARRGGLRLVACLMAKRDELSDGCATLLGSPRRK